MNLASLGFWEAGTLNGWVTVAIALGSFVFYLIAYFTYGRWLSRKIFKLDPAAPVPSVTMRDDLDYVPSKKVVVFGHHFTSIAGTGPIVGPAIAIVWGWLPALLWVLFGAVFMGAVHDFGSLIVSMRNKGQSIGEVCAKLVNPRVRTLFAMVIFLVLWIVIAVFCYVIAKVFSLPEEGAPSVIPVWLEIPIAMVLGYAVYKRGANPILAGVIAVIVMYGTIVLGAYVPVVLPSFHIGSLAVTPMILWTLILLVYVFFASTLPVQMLLQPRDYINAYELGIAMLLLVAGVLFSRPGLVAPAVQTDVTGAPGGMWPLLFITIACGAISGFHSLVASGTSPKQLRTEADAKAVGYGSMLTEGFLAVLVILAVAAGIGMGVPQEGGPPLTGTAAWNLRYGAWGAADPMKVFINGSANMLAPLGISKEIGLAIMGVFLVSFAGTTIDTATRLQRYVVAELATDFKLNWLARPRIATAFAVITAGILALMPGGKENAPGGGGMILWPLFGTVNQLLAGLALLAVTVYLARRGFRRAVLVTLLPMAFMLFMTAWALVDQLREFYTKQNWLLFSIAVAIFVLEAWMVIESLIVFVGVLRGKEARAAAAAEPAGE